MKTSIRISKRLAYLLVVIIATITIAWLVFVNGRHHVSYDFATVDRGPVERSVSASGTLRPVEVVDVGAQTSGMVLAVNADFGTKVKQGQLLAVVDPTNAESALLQAKAQIGSSNANEEQGRAALSGAESELRRAQLEYERRGALLQKGFSSRRDVEASKAALDQARASRDQGEARIRSAQADETRSQAQMVEAHTNLERTRIVSPIEGVVIERRVAKGQTLASAFQAPVLFRIAADLRNMQIDVFVDEADIGDVQVGQVAHFTVDAFPDDTFKGRVSQVRQQANTTQGAVSYTVVLDALNVDQRLRPGMTANVNIVTGYRPDVLRVVTSALSFAPEVKVKSAGISVSIVSEGEANRLRQGAPERSAVADGKTLWKKDDTDPMQIKPEVPVIGLRGDRYTELRGGDVGLGDRVAIRMTGLTGDDG